mgnify:CR=1 FL=1
MFGFILDYLVNVIVLCVAIPVTEKIFDCQIRGFDSLLTYLNIPVTSGTELMMTSAGFFGGGGGCFFFFFFFFSPCFFLAWLFFLCWWEGHLGGGSRF